MALLSAAFRSGREVGIGLTSDRYLGLHPKPGAEAIRPYDARRRALGRYLHRAYPRRRWWVVPLEDAFGGSVDPGVDVLVVSEETAPAAGLVNAERSRRGLPVVRVVIVPIQRGADLRPIAGRRIRDGEIDPRGRRLVPLGLAVRAPRERLAALQRALLRRFDHVAVTWVGRPSDAAPAALPDTEASALASPALPPGVDYALALAPSRDGTDQLILLASDPEGPVGAARGPGRDGRAIDRLVRELFAQRRPVPGARDRPRSARNV
jgi:phosphopantetheine adenylyltransferase